MRNFACAVLVAAAVSACGDDGGIVTKFDVQDVSVTTMEDTPISVQVPVVANSQVQATVTTPPGHGAITSDDNGAATIYTYTPASNYNGSDTIAITFDNGKEQKVGHIAITVTPVNDPPNAVADSFATGFSMPLTVQTSTLLLNDTDPEDMPLTVTGVAAGEHGTVVLTGSEVVFTPESGFQGKASFTYDVSDGMATAHGQVTVTIGGNHPPVAVNDSANGIEDTNIVIAETTLLANDSDPDGQTLAVSGFLNPTHGVVSMTGTSVTFTPDPNYNGAASFQYLVTDGADTATGTVNLTIAAVNDPPVVIDDTATTPEDTALVIPTSVLLNNDSDVDSTTITVSAVSAASSGTVSLAGGNVTYTPGANFNGIATFTYTVSDGQATTNGTVTVTVTPVNDAPVAVDDTIPGTEDTTSILTAAMLTANDTDVDGDALTVTAVGNPTHGTVSLAAGTITFVPAPDYNGPATFDYTVSDGALTDTGTVTLMIAAVNDAPTAVNDTLVTNEDTPITAPVTVNDLDVDGDTLTVSAVTQGQHGTVTFSGGSVTYSPFADYNGPDTFTYTTNDGHGGTSTATVSVTVNPINDPPQANADSLTTAEDTPGSVDPIANDADVEGDTLSLVSVGTAAHGTLTVNGNLVTYTPAPDYFGPDMFSYRVTDGVGGTSDGTVRVTVTPVDDAPVGVNDQYSVQDPSVPFTVTATAGVLVNDHDVDNTNLTAQLITQPAHGDLVFNADGSFTYTARPEDPCPIEDSFTYQVSDGTLQSPAVTVSLVINRAPIADSDYYYLFESGGSGGSNFWSIDIPAGSGFVNYDVFDPNGDAVTVSLVDAPQKADSFVLNPDGSFFYLTTDPEWCNDFFTYTASDGTLTSDIAEIDLYDYYGDSCGGKVVAAQRQHPQTTVHTGNIYADFKNGIVPASGPCCFINEGFVATGQSFGGTCQPADPAPGASTAAKHPTSAMSSQ